MKRIAPALRLIGYAETSVCAGEKGKGMGTCLLSAQGSQRQRIAPACEPVEVAQDVHRNPQEAFVLELDVTVQSELRIFRVRIVEGSRDSFVDVPLQWTFFAGFCITADSAVSCT